MKITYKYLCPKLRMTSSYSQLSHFYLTSSPTEYLLSTGERYVKISAVLPPRTRMPDISKCINTGGGVSVTGLIKLPTD